MFGLNLFKKQPQQPQQPAQPFENLRELCSNQPWPYDLKDKTPTAIEIELRDDTTIKIDNDHIAWCFFNATDWFEPFRIATCENIEIQIDKEFIETEEGAKIAERLLSKQDIYYIYMYYDKSAAKGSIYEYLNDKAERYDIPWKNLEEAENSNQKTYYNSYGDLIIEIENK